MLRIYLLFGLQLLTFLLFGQSSCILGDYDIQDDRLAAIPIIVSGATTDLTNDKLCNISIRFTHESINQLRITLVSPSGQRLNIMGPATTPSNPSFPPIQYDVSFVQCAQTPVPDIGYQARWDNGQIWFGPNIQGSYYPYQGCLEDLNTGSINGTWILEIEDAAQFDLGVIQCLNFEFCNSKDISTQFCNTTVGRFRIASDSYCENQTYNLAAVTSFPNGMSPASSYDNKYAISNGSRLVAYADGDIEMGTLLPGTYTVCQYSVFRPDATSLPLPGTDMPAGDFGSEFARLGLCGAVSNCIELVVKPVTDSIFVSPPPICLGSSYRFRNFNFDTTGTYYVPIPNIDANLCDSIFVINLQVLDLTPQIVADNPRLACNLFSITLTAENALYSDTAKFVWTTANGNITYTNMDTIHLDRIGTYRVTVMDQGCQASATYEVEYDPSAPVISVSADTITCDKPNATVTVTSTGSIASTDWLGVGMPLGINQVLIGSPGPVDGFVVHADGCRVPIPTIDVKIDTTTTLPVISASPSALNCVNRSTRLQVSNAGIFRNSLQFFYINPSTGNPDLVLNPDNVTDVGTYRVDAIMARNGCPVTQTFELRDTSYTPSLSLETFCRDREVWVRGVSDRPFGSLVWNGPNGPSEFNNTSIEQRVNTDGIYSLSFISRSGCPARDTFIDINVSEEFPIFEVPDDSISCLNNTTFLEPITTQFNATYHWTGPYNYDTISFVAKVTAIGTYIGTASFANGCMTRDTVRVTLFTSISDPSFKPDIIVDCSEDTIRLEPNDTITYSYIWLDSISPPILSSLTNPVALVELPGVYRVLAIDRISGCRIKLEVAVGDERDLPILQDSLTRKTCMLNSHASISIIPDSLSKVNSIEWTGPAGFTSGSLKIDSLAEGTYVYKLTTQKGCNLKDTFQIAHDLQLPIVNLRAMDTINCSGNFSKAINPTSDRGEDQFTWLAGSAVFSQSRNITINRQNFNTNNTNGLFTLIVKRPSNGCESPPVNIQMAWDTLATQITKLGADISCIEPSPTISYQSAHPVFSVEWRKNGVVVPGNTPSLVVNGPGLYTFRNTDTRRCVVTDTIRVDDLRDSVAYGIFTEVVGCEGGIIQLKGIQGIQSVLWQGPEAIADDSTSAVVSLPGDYIFNMITPLGCVYVDTINLTEDKTSPLVVTKMADTLTCSLTTTDIGFTLDKGLRQVKWFTDGSDTVTTNGALAITAPGTYKAVIKADNNCTVSDSIVVVQNIAKPFLRLLTDSLVCSRSFARVRVDSSSTIRNYEWTGPDGFAAITRDINAVLPGIYALQAFGLNGCDTTVSVEVRDVKRIPNLSLPDSFYIPCNGDSAKIAVVSDQPIRLYRWTSSTSVLSTSDTLSTTQPGKVYLNVLSTENCQAQDSIVLQYDIRKTDAVVAGNDILCMPDSTYLSASLTTENIGYWWLSPQNTRHDSVLTLTSAEAGTYLFIVEKSYACLDTFPITIQVDNTVPQILSINQDSPLLCTNTQVNLWADISHAFPDRLQYRWNLDGNALPFTDSTAVAQNPGTFMLTLRDSVNFCTDTLSYEIVQEVSSLIRFDAFPTAPACFGGEDGQIELQSVLGGFGPFKIRLNRPGDIVNDSLIVGLEARQYVVTLTDRWGCELSTSILVPNGLFFDADLPADTSVRLGDEVLIPYETSLQQALLGPVNFYFNGEVICRGCDAASFSPLFTGDLVVEVFSDEGCVAYDTMTIYVGETIDWLFPNIIRPGTDNGSFYLPENPGVDVVEEVSIYDRWGNKVYSRNDLIPGDPGSGWDGSFQNRDLVPGVYVVYVRALLKNGRMFQTRRDITLLR